MKNEQGFSLVELLIVVAIIAIIAAIAVPSLLTSRMAANESSGIEGCRTVGSAQVAFASTNNQMYALFADLVAGNFLDDRFTNATGFNGYTYAEDQAVVGLPAGIPTTVAADGFGVVANPVPGSARYVYGIGPDQVVRYQSFVAPAIANPGNMAPGDGIGIKK
jgi:prepilin-type N-terminal cleavage/methylation domain-containing protein